jgi:hypothetical protein
MNGHIAWVKGGTATFLELSGENVVLRSSIPSPPGSRLEATFLADPAAGAVGGVGAVMVKVHGSKKEDDGAFTIRGRLVSATREVRARVAALVEPG